MRITVFKRPAPPKEPPTHYYEVELIPEQRILLLEVIRRSSLSPRQQQPLIEALAEARLMNKPLIRSKLDWTYAEKEAKRRGSSIAEWLFDRPKLWE